MKIIKIIFITILGLVILTGVLAGIAIKQLATQKNIVKVINENSQANATLEEVNVQWFPLAIHLKGLSLNPKDMKLKTTNVAQPAISLGELILDVDLTAAAKKKIKITKIELKQAVINAAILSNGELDILQWLAPNAKTQVVINENIQEQPIVYAGVGSDQSLQAVFVLDSFLLDNSTLNLQLVKEKALVNIRNLSVSTKDFQYPLAQQMLTHSISVNLSADIDYEQTIVKQQESGSAKAQLLLSGTTTMSYLVDKGEFFPNIINTNLAVDEQSEITVSDNLLSELNQVISLASQLGVNLPAVGSTFKVDENISLVAEYNAPKETVSLLQPISLTSNDWGMTLASPGSVNLAQQTQKFGVELIANQAVSEKAAKQMSQGTLAKLGLDKLLFTDDRLTLKGQLKGSFKQPKISVDESLKPKNLIKETLKTEVGNQIKNLLGF